MFPALLLGALLWSPIVVMAWLKVGVVAGIVATVVFGLAFLVAIQPGAQMFGNLPGSWFTMSQSRRNPRRGGDERGSRQPRGQS